MNLYLKHYSEPRFERAGLFRLIRERYGCKEALYPGSFVHITPSFYFPHVVYVDNNPTAIEFFGDPASLLELINRNKDYKRSAYVRFIGQDYAEGLSLGEGSFDLLISLYASGAAQACNMYLKRGGILATNNFQNEALEFGADPAFRLVGAAFYHKGDYQLVEQGLEGRLRAAGKARNQRYLKQSSSGLEYSENEVYFFFRKEMDRG